MTEPANSEPADFDTNVTITTLTGQRSHVERKINDGEAAVIRRVFELSAEGHGFTMIAKTLNADGASTPRPQRGRPAAWVSSSVREVLNRSLYRGELVWNQTAKRDQWGHNDESSPKRQWRG